MQINRYSMCEVARKAPDRPGVYVWYCNLCIGKADVQNDDGFLNLLNSYSARFGRQNMSVIASLNFNLEWEGNLSPCENTIRGNVLHNGGLSEPTRVLVSAMLEVSQPIFFQPLYIGKAERSLRNRLLQHVNEFVRLKELLRNSKSIQYEGEDDFAQRAVALGYNEDQLVVHTIDVGNVDALDGEQIGKAVSLVEMYLNNWSAPLLGRR